MDGIKSSGDDLEALLRTQATTRYPNTISFQADSNKLLQFSVSITKAKFRRSGQRRIALQQNAPSRGAYRNTRPKSITVLWWTQ